MGFGWEQAGKRGKENHDFVKREGERLMGGDVNERRG